MKEQLLFIPDEEYCCMTKDTSGKGTKGPFVEAGNAVTYLEPALWRQLGEAETERDFCFFWLQLQCRMISDTVCGVVFLSQKEGGGNFAPVAFWPQNQRSYAHLSGVIEQAIKEQKGVVLRSDSEEPLDVPAEQLHFYLAFPIKIYDVLYGIAALEVGPRPPARLQTAMRQLQWGVPWLENWILRQQSGATDQLAKRLNFALEITAIALQEKGFKAAATACCTELATRLGCDRVSIGFLKKGQVRVEALSHSAQFGKQMNLIRAIGNAMDESLEQAALLLYPPPEQKQQTILRAHAELARQHNSDTILTIPFLDAEGEGYGALTLERTSASEQDFFDQATVDLCDTVASFIGPILDEKRLNDRPLPGKIKSSLQHQLGKIVGAEHMTAKLIVLGGLVLVVFFAFAQGDYRVTAKTTLEGEIQRAVTAPFEGYLDEAEVKAGDLVRDGQIMARLDDRDLQLERSKWASQLAQHQLENRKAMAEDDIAAASILQQQVLQAEAQLRLLDEQLARTKITAPFNGLVVSGDLSQSLGTPLEKGQVLFEIAPLDSYRVILQVDETEIGAIKSGQQGQLILTAMPETPLSFTVRKITPVTLAEEGRSFFKVEATLDEHSARLRPGMAGYGKTFVDRRHLIWIWTHDLITWLRLKMWAWLP
jgi:RND family efflux transporter MFP subunit